MDLPLYLRVIWRFKLLVAAGTLLAIGLAFLSVFKVSLSGPKHVAFRQSQLWSDDVTLLVAPQRFPWGSQNPGQSADPATYGQLATIYANLATSDAVKELVNRDGHGRVDFAAEPFIAAVVPYSYQNSSSPPLPLVTLEAQAATQPRVKELVQRESNAFLKFLQLQQSQNDIPAKERVSVAVVKGDQIRLLKPRSKTTPIVVFMLVMIATLGLAFMLENLRPRVRLVSSEDVVLASADEVRRSA